MITKEHTKEGVTSITYYYIIRLFNGCVPGTDKDLMWSRREESSQQHLKKIMIVCICISNYLETFHEKTYKYIY